MRIATVLITGATAGIGRHAALEFARRGHQVIATGRREDALEELKREASALKGRIDTLRLDVTDEPAVRAAAEAVLPLTNGHGVDVLVNSAGYGQMGPVEAVSDAEVRKQFDTNVFGLLNVIRAFLPAMRARGEGRIINVGSLGGRITFPLMGIYNATKYAVESISDALRNEVAGFGIDVSIVEPGPIRTAFNERAMATVDTARFAGSAYERIVAKGEALSARFEARAAGPEVTTRAIVHAALARRPRTRYVVPFSAALMLAILSFCPTFLVDLVIRAVAGLTPGAMRKA